MNLSILRLATGPGRPRVIAPSASQPAVDEPLADVPDVPQPSGRDEAVVLRASNDALRGWLVRAEKERAAALARIEPLETIVRTQHDELERWRTGHAARCSDARDLRGVRIHNYALQQQLSELQQANESYEARGFAPRASSRP